MNPTELHNKIVALAKANPPSARVPYAFEKRIMARLAVPLPADSLVLWGRALWRAAAPCVGLMLALAILAAALPREADPAENLSQDLENTVFFAVNQPGD
ncbi:MAG: hypothetical protein HZA89_09010 [Verrucomicrobia bacterium]|nr:hypothetical protein [Verrucomicrobiota bacterium]